MRLLLRLALALGLLLALASAGAYWHVNRRFDHAVAPVDGEPVIFTVTKGATLRAIGERLAEVGLIESAFYWQLYNRLHPGPGAKAGRHALRRDMSLRQLRAAIAENPLPEDEPLTIVEGWRLRDIDAELTRLGRIEAGAYLRAASEPVRFSLRFPLEGAQDLEGYTFPETYMVPPGPLDVEKLIQRQLDAFAERFYLPHQEELAKQKRTLRELVVMASMLEREEPKPALRPEVAGILWKRLDASWALGVDATSRYTLDDWSDRKKFLKQLRDETDVYNTRLRLGLPPGPIGAPSLPSLVAALRPVESPYWYYLHDKDQNIRFAKDAAGHEANRKKYNVY